MQREPKGYCSLCNKPFYSSGPYCSSCEKAISGVNHTENFDRKAVGRGKGKGDRDDFYNSYEDAIEGNYE
jgi:hypothetical protein